MSGLLSLVTVVTLAVTLGHARIIYKKLEGEKDVHPEEMADLFEGDIDVGKFRNAVYKLSMTWKGGVVPYVIESDYADFALESIRAAMARIEEATAVNGKKCVQFVKRKRHPDYIAIKKILGCSSKIGRIGGRQEFSIVPGCYSKGTIMHELVHSLGFWHEQSRADRDNYIMVFWDNIKAGHAGNFQHRPAHLVHHLGVGYDYGSIMHYPEDSFTKDGKPTIMTLDPYAKIGQRDDLSPLDIKKIRILYGCIEGDRPPDDRTEAAEKNLEDAVFSCNFDDGGWCGIETSDGTPSWELDSAYRGMEEETGPNGDHTSQTGKYAVVRNPDKSGTSADLYLPELEPSESGYCLDLWLSMYGEKSGMFNVGTQNVKGIATIFWNQGEEWTHKAYTINDKESVEIQLSAIWGDRQHGDVAVDDIAVYKGPC